MKTPDILRIGFMAVLIAGGAGAAKLGEVGMDTASAGINAIGQREELTAQAKSVEIAGHPEDAATLNWLADQSYQRAERDLIVAGFEGGIAAAGATYFAIEGVNIIRRRANVSQLGEASTVVASK
jgi:hypothetical protein